MLNKLRRARADLATMNTLFPAAESIAREEGIDEPGAEHLLLAALQLDDTIAVDVLRACHVDSAEFREAIVAQHADALRSIEVFADDNAINAALPAGGEAAGPYRSQGSLQAAFQRAVALARGDQAALNSGYILLAVAEAEHGTVVRTLRHLGVEPTLLRDHTRELVARSSAR